MLTTAPCRPTLNPLSEACRYREANLPALGVSPPEATESIQVLYSKVGLLKPFSRTYFAITQQSCKNLKGKNCKHNK